jgi:hypothetical protein
MKSRRALRTRTRSYGDSIRSGGAPGSNPEPKASQSQVDLLKTLAVELRGEAGAGRLEATTGRPLPSPTRDEADSWIDRLAPKRRAPPTSS